MKCKILLDNQFDTAAGLIPNFSAMRTKEKENTIKEFLQNDFMKIVNIDRYIGEIARNLTWGFNVNPKNSIHVAISIFIK